MQPSRSKTFALWSAVAAMSLALAACSSAEPAPTTNSRRVPPAARSSSSRANLRPAVSSQPARRPTSDRTSAPKVSVQAPKPSSSSRKSSATKRSAAPKKAAPKPTSAS